MADTVLPVGTPEGVTIQLHPAGPLPRLMAVLIDLLLELLNFCFVFSYDLKLDLFHLSFFVLLHQVNLGFLSYKNMRVI